MMSSTRSWATRLLAAALALACVAGARSAVATTESAAARVVVRLRAGSPLASARASSAAAATAARADALGARLLMPLRGGATVSELALVVFASGLTSAELAERLAEDSEVEYAVPDERRWIVGAALRAACRRERLHPRTL